MGGIKPPQEKNRSYKMDKMIIYTHSSEILIVANADNADLLCEYVGLLTNIPFPKCNFSCYIDNSENKFMRYQSSMVDITSANAMQHIA